jgi:hypothetical protein
VSPPEPCQGNVEQEFPHNLKGRQGKPRKIGKLDHWIERRIWSHRYKRWRNGGWQQLPKRKLYGEYGLVQLVKLIPSIALQRKAPS